ncbi:hypothetical protein ACIOWI_30305 [Streptomyces sp. NPDC087659]|uniref:hypothetical protein n=1 Tax=Streptomyces sp. NPDC087659 TaxID=3365801 RepID=UPI00380C2CC8
MDAGDWISLGSGAVAGIAAGIAFWQALSAKTSATIARSQMVAAQEQVVAAREQVAIMALQLTYQTDDRNDAAGPRFEVLTAELIENEHGQQRAAITVAQTLGSELSAVTVSARQSQQVYGLMVSNGVGSVTWGVTAPGSTYEIKAMLAPNCAEPLNVVLDFRCTEANGGRTWHRTLTATPRPPELKWSTGFTFR